MSDHDGVVALDVGETLIDETGQWTAWAHWLGQTPFTLLVALGAVLERREPFKSVFAMFDPDFDIDAEIARRTVNGTGYRITEGDLHPDVRPALATWAAGGLRVVIAGTMTVAEQDQIWRLNLEVADVISNGQLGHANHEPEFFHQLARRLAIPHHGLHYISHRHDRVAPAAAQAGVTFRWLRRGPLARIRPPSTGQPLNAADTLSDIAATHRPVRP